MSAFPFGGAQAAPVGTDRFEPTRALQLLGAPGVDIATGWVPAGSDIQVSFELHADDGVVVSMPGDALFDWSDAGISFEGDPDQGAFELEVGVLLEARVRFDLLGNVFESEIIGPYDLGVFEQTSFTPYLLAGNPHRPAVIERLTAPSEVFVYPLVDAVIASGEFVLDAAFDVEVSLQCQAIEVALATGAVTSVVTESMAALVAVPASGEDLLADATLRCTTRSNVRLLLYPGVQVTLGLETFELSPFELPVPLLADQEDAFDFEALPLWFEAPALPGTTTDGGTGTSRDGSTGDASPSGEGGGSGESGRGEGTGTDSGTDGGGALGEPLQGCGCRPSAPAPVSMVWMTLAVLGLGCARRRYR
jgi:MYXO-CTERM domain-containing protein